MFSYCRILKTCMTRWIQDEFANIDWKCVMAYIGVIVFVFVFVFLSVETGLGPNRQIGEVLECIHRRH